MARITVEDCLDHVDNRFDLVLVGAKRARQLANGVEPLLPWQNDKPTVMALREIADGLIKPAMLAEADRAAEDAAEALEKALAAEFGIQEFDDEAPKVVKTAPAVGVPDDAPGHAPGDAPDNVTNALSDGAPDDPTAQPASDSGSEPNV